MIGTKLIVLRGPSGAGKSTVAKALQQASRRNVLIIEQDYFRHTLLADKPDTKSVVPELVYTEAKLLLDAGYDVVVEGIFRKEKYKPMFERLIEAHSGASYVFYFDIGFEETAKRHATRSKAADFTPDEMKEWFGMAAPLEMSCERVIPEAHTKGQTVSFVRDITKL